MDMVLKDKIKELMTVNSEKFLDTGSVTVINEDIIKIKFFNANYCETLVEVTEALPFWNEGKVEKGSATSVNPAVKLCHEFLLYDIHAMVWNTFADYLHLFLKKILDNHYVTADFSAELINYNAGRTKVSRLKKGDFNHAHCFTNYHGFNYAETIISMISQLNKTTDFTGGGLYFPRQQINVSLSIGEVLVFPSGFTHPITYQKVEKGNRYLLESHMGRLSTPS